MNSLSIPKAAAQSAAVTPQYGARDVAVDYLRALVIVLVIFLHASLAYTAFSTFDQDAWIDATAPVVDTDRWSALDPLAWYYDTFLMPLLFLISGLFTLTSLRRQGSGAFFRARLRRLGIPFVVSVIVLSPLHFLPAYLRASPDTQQTPYLATFFTSDGWPVGAPWFLWVLLALDGMIALVYRFAPQVLAKLDRQPTASVVFLVAIGSFLPLRLFGSHFGWLASLGPFDVQPVRVGLYLAFFLLGAALGTGQAWRGVGWPRGWPYWLILGLVSFGVYVVFLAEIVPSSALPSAAMQGVTFAASCAGTSLGLLGAFGARVRTNHPVLDSLSANSYGIYLVHYLIVVWIQCALLSVSWPAGIKFGVALVGTVALSWGISGLARRIPAVRQII